MFEGYCVDFVWFVVVIFGIGCWFFGFSFFLWWGFEFGFLDWIWGCCILCLLFFWWLFILDEVFMIVVVVLCFVVLNWSGCVVVGDVCFVVVWERIGWVDGCGFGFFDVRCWEIMYFIGFDGFWVCVGYYVVWWCVVGYGSSVELRGVMGDVWMKLLFEEIKLMFMELLVWYKCCGRVWVWLVVCVVCWFRFCV